MALDRFSNKQEIIDTNGLVRGSVWRLNDQESLGLDIKQITPSETPAVEFHLYTPNGDYVSGGITTAFSINVNSLKLDYGAAATELGVTRGAFETVVNVHRNILGDMDMPILQVKQISNDRRELQLRYVPIIEFDDTVDDRQAIIDDYLVNNAPFERDLAVNFGRDRVYKIIGQKEWTDDFDFVVRLYQPIDDDIVLNDTAWIVEELTDSYTDNIFITAEIPGEELTELRGPNWDIDVQYGTVTETDFKNWNDLLGSNLNTTQQIIDSYFSGSLNGVNIGIDYSGLQNFVFYSSAQERLRNFNYKLSLIEYYNNRITALEAATGTDDTSLQGNIASNRARRDDVIGGFDGYERWLYYEPTASIFTHQTLYDTYDEPLATEGGFIGAQHYRIAPYPKRLVNGAYVLHASTSSLATNWYAGALATASLYDTENPNALVKTIPEHIRNDANNDQYELFINMIGHHFDVLYAYTDALSRTYKPEEHPKLGVSRETLYNVAESLGWRLANGKQATALWQYKLGTDQSGSYAQSGSLASKSDEDITTEIWRRIVNNLPYLLKTKGTARSIKALMNTYGIPQTLLSIREYGGPKVSEDVPLLIEDRFSYALQFDGNSRIETVNTFYSSSIGNWGIDRGEIPSITRELRFRPAVKQNMLLLTVNQGNIVYNAIALQYTGSYSGSDAYGRIVYSHGLGVSNSVPMTGSTDWLPLYDGDIWNMRWYYTTTGDHYNTGSNTDTTYHIEVQKASDYISDKIIHSASLSVTPVNGTHTIGWGGSVTDLLDFTIAGRGGTVSDIVNVAAELTDAMGADTYPTPFSGSMQEFREWLELIDKPTFDIHTKNPTSYVSALSPTGSWDTLIKHYPMGTDLNAVDHNAITSITSSHPNQDIKDFSPPFLDTNSSYGTAIGFPVPTNAQRGNYEPVEETYYIQGVSLGGVLPKSQKIRFDDNTLVRRLSPNSRGERSRFDYASTDSNRLGLFYSISDQVNKDIFNHIGDVALDDYVGDPDDEFENEYPDLKNFSEEYWKKYNNPNDVNAFIRVFSQFDFALFDQIRQLLPERVDEVMGLLVEPHALERRKVRLTKRPVVENPQYEVVITQQEPSASADYILYEADITMPNSQLTSSFETEHLFNVNAIGDPYEASNYCTLFTPPVDEIDGAKVQWYPGDIAWVKIFQRQTTTDPENGTWSNLDTAAVSFSNDNAAVMWSLLDTGTSANDIYNVRLFNSQFDQVIRVTEGIKINAPLAELSYTVYCRFVQLDDNDRIKHVLFENVLTATTIAGSRDFTMLSNVDLQINAFQRYATVYTITYNGVGSANTEIDYIKTSFNIVKTCHNVIQPIIDTPRESDIFSRVVNHYSGSESYGDLVTRNGWHAVSQSLGYYYSQSLEPAAYMDDFPYNLTNLFYNGCQLTGPGVNQPSNNIAIGNTPVVEIFEVNPNQLIFTGQRNVPTTGTGLSPGNLNVR